MSQIELSRADCFLRGRNTVGVPVGQVNARTEVLVSRGTTSRKAEGLVTRRTGGWEAKERRVAIECPRLTSEESKTVLLGSC